jgi:hypothetical protein
MTRSSLGVILVLVASGLIVINIIGLTRSLRNPAVLELNHFESDIQISEEEFYEIISQPESSNKEYAIKVNSAVNDVIAHFWAGSSQAVSYEPHISEFNLQVPIYENYLLFMAYELAPDSRYEFCDYRKAVERGVGLCSQESMIFDAIMDENEIPSKIILYPDFHVVNTVLVDARDDIWWVFDPDHGVVIEHDIVTITSQPDLVKSFYLDAGYDLVYVESLIQSYSLEEYFLRNSVISYKGGVGCFSEAASYYLIWFIPVVFMVAGLKYLRREFAEAVGEI